MHSPIKKWTLVMMVVVALVFDIVQMILDFLGAGVILDTILSILAWVVFFFWFRIHGVKFSGKMANAFGTGFLIELIPILNFLPAWTATVIRLYLQTKIPAVVQVAVNPKQAATNMVKNPAQAATGALKNVNK